MVKTHARKRYSVTALLIPIEATEDQKHHNRYALRGRGLVIVIVLLPLQEKQRISNTCFVAVLAVDG